MTDEFVLSPITNNEIQEVLIEENFDVENQEVGEEEQIEEKIKEES
jgi:hypothetical protein